MKPITLIFSALLLGAAVSQAQEYRVQQQLPDTLNEITIVPGWEVVIIQELGQPNNITIVTPCEMFYTEGNEPEVCSINKHALEILSNTSMPKNTILEIHIGNPLKELYIRDSAHVETGNLFFTNHPRISIGKYAVVKGGSWRCDTSRSHVSTRIFQGMNSTLSIDTLSVAKGKMDVEKDATFNYRFLTANYNLRVRKHRTVSGTTLASDSANNVTVKRLSGFANYMYNTGLQITGAISYGIPVFRNHRYGSAYNIGESYGIILEGNLVPLAIVNNRLQWAHRLRLEWKWTRLLSDVECANGALVFSSALQNDVVHQNLYSLSIGIPLELIYTISKKSGFYTWIGLAPTYIFKSNLVTRVLEEDDCWHRSTDRADVYNPFQLRATFGIGNRNGYFGRFSIDFFVDLLPTYRSSIGAEGFHQMGVNIHF